MARLVRDVMTADPVSLPDTATVVEAARAMRDNDIGAVVITRRDGTPCGLVTDRDIAVRAIADGRDAASTPAGEICSERLTAVAPTTPIEEAVRTLRRGAIRRLPVIEDGRVVGILSLGDLAIDRDPDSALAGISSAPANN